MKEGITSITCDSLSDVLSRCICTDMQATNSAASMQGAKHYTRTHACSPKASHQSCRSTAQQELFKCILNGTKMLLNYCSTVRPCLELPLTHTCLLKTCRSASQPFQSGAPLPSVLCQPCHHADLSSTSMKVIKLAIRASFHFGIFFLFCVCVCVFSCPHQKDEHKRKTGIGIAFKVLLGRASKLFCLQIINNNKKKGSLDVIAVRTVVSAQAGAQWWMDLNENVNSEKRSVFPYQQVSVEDRITTCWTGQY